MSSLRALWGLVAVGIYLLLVGLLLFYFAHYHNKERKHYVKKNEDRVTVSLATKIPQAATKQRSAKKPKQKVKPKRKVRPKPKPKPKKRVVKRIAKAKNVPKKHKEHNRTKPSKQKIKDLFASVDIPKKPLIRVTDKPIKQTPQKPLFTMTEKRPSASERIRDALKRQPSHDSGVEDAYLAHVQEMLEDWPAQSDFAGEKVKVHLKIDPTGHFEFALKRRSNNPDFNDALTHYLQQLQEFGFGPHKGSRTYLFEAEFVAKE